MELHDNKLDYIINVICNYFNINKKTLNLKTRKREIAEARQFYFYFARKLTTCSLELIGSYVNRDHATVIHGYNRIKSFKHIGFKPLIFDIINLENKFEEYPVSEINSMNFCYLDDGLININHVLKEEIEA